MKHGILPAIDPGFGYNGGSCIEQNPYELAACCQWLAERGVKSYLEVGLGSGGLMKFMVESFGMEKCFGADLRMPPGLPQNAATFTGDTHSDEFSQWILTLPPLDLIWIDADHRYESVWSDAKFCSIVKHRFMAFHDICGLRECEGSARHWNETKAKYPGRTVEFCHPGPTAAGIGILMNGHE